MSKAFDTVDHTILLHKLHHYGIRGSLHRWFQSYLSDRRQYVSVNNVSSDLENVQYGVPQGSSLGPLLFLLYINDLPNAVTQSETRLFADDANQFIRNKSIQLLKNTAEDVLLRISQWMTCNKMTINYDKTNFSIFSPKHSKINPAIFDSLNFGGRTVKRANCIKYLGIHIDEQLTWKNHIEFLHTKLRQFCGIFYKYRSLIPAPCLKQLYFSLINSSIQYGIEIYANTNATFLDDLKVLNNRILRILQFRNIRTRITLLYSTFNTLPIHLLHKYKLCLLVFNFLNNKMYTSGFI